MPNPAANAAANCPEAFASDASMRSRITGTVSLLSSRRKRRRDVLLLDLGLTLSKNNRACV